MGSAKDRSKSNGQWVEIQFDCLPLRSVGRIDIPIDASPKYREHCERVKAAMEKHGVHNSYFVYNATCVFHLTNDDELGTLQFRFVGTVLTDQTDMRCQRCDLEVELIGETCDWLTEPIVRWFGDTVPRSVAVEFDRYIDAGDLKQTQERIAKIQQASDEADGYVGMYL
ncbi:MAG: hypothetical protein R3E01_30205 [Pirellulaceae bacterium]|nr:hypothetical protein [Planctomycetales bacterium]